MDYATFIADPLILMAGFNQPPFYEPVVSQVISEVECLESESRYSNCSGSCDRRELAIKYRVAHRLTLLRQNGVLSGDSESGLSVGQIQSISASQGSQSLSFSSNSSATKDGKNLWLAEGDTSTYWWELYLGVRATKAVSIGFVA